MKESTSMVFTLLLALVFAAPQEAMAAKTKTCSVKTLKGTYLFSATGRIDGGDYSEAGLETFDGNANVSALSTTNSTESATVTGSYTLDADCHGTITYTDGESNDIYVSIDGSTLRYIMNPSNTKISPSVSGQEQRVSK